MLERRYEWFFVTVNCNWRQAEELMWDLYIEGYTKFDRKDLSLNHRYFCVNPFDLNLFKRLKNILRTSLTQWRFCLWNFLLKCEIHVYSLQLSDDEEHGIVHGVSGGHSKRWPSLESCWVAPCYTCFMTEEWTFSSLRNIAVQLIFY